MTQSCYPPDEAQGLWVYLEQEEGQLEGVSLELLGKGRELADAHRSQLTGLLLGHQVLAVTLFEGFNTLLTLPRFFGNNPDDI